MVLFFSYSFQLCPGLRLFSVSAQTASQGRRSASHVACCSTALLVISMRVLYFVPCKSNRAPAVRATFLLKSPCASFFPAAQLPSCLSPTAQNQNALARRNT
jgi:hypothetical protein